MLYFVSIETPAFDYNGDVCVEFDYHMYGSHIGELKVYTSRNGEDNAFFEEDGDQGNKWIHQASDVSFRRDDRVS